MLAIVSAGSVLAGRGGGVFGEEVLVGVFAAGAWVLSLYVGRADPIGRASKILVFAVVAAYLTASITSADPWLSAVFFFPVLAGLFGYLTARASPWDSTTSGWILVVAGGAIALTIVWSAVAGAWHLLGFVSKVTGVFKIDLSLLPRGAGISAHPNLAAMTLLPPFGLAVGAAVRGEERRRRLGAVLAGLIGAGLLVTGSRGGLLGAAVAIAVILALGRKERVRAIRPRPLTVGIAMGVVSGAGLLIAFHPRFLLRSFGRGDIWEATARLIAERPLTGWGPGTLALVLPSQYVDPTRYSPAVWHAHNAYLQMIGELGLIGVGVILAGGIWAWRSRTGARHSSSGAQTAVRMGALAGLAGVAVHGVFDSTQLFPGAMVMLGFAIGTGGKRDVPDDRSEQSELRRRLLAVGLAVVTILVGAWLLVAPANGRRAVSLADSGDWAGAYEVLRAGSQVGADPGSAEQLALAAFRSGDRDGAAAWIQQAIRRQPYEWTRWVVAAQIAAARADRSGSSEYVSGALQRGAATSPVGLMALLPLMDQASSTWFEAAVDLVQEYPAVQNGPYWGSVGADPDRIAQVQAEAERRAVDRRTGALVAADVGDDSGYARRLRGTSALESGSLEVAQLELATAVALGDLRSANILLESFPLTASAREAVIRRGWSIVAGITPVRAGPSGVSAPTLWARWYLAMRMPSVPPGPVLPGSWQSALPPDVKDFFRLAEAS